VIAVLAPAICFAWVILNPFLSLGLAFSALLVVYLVRRIRQERGLAFPLATLLLGLLLTQGISGCASGPSERSNKGSDSAGVLNDPNAPYIAKLRAKIEEDEAPPSESGSFIASEKAKLAKESEAPTGSYIDAVRKKLEESGESSRDEPQGSFIERERLKILADEDSQPHPDSSGSAIADLKKGVEIRKARKLGNIHHGMGFKFGASIERRVSAPSSLSSGVTFDALYAKQVAPDFTLSYEFQPFHSEWFGSLGFGAQAGFALYRGYGSYSVSLPGFGSTSDTEFRFVFIPLMATVNYRFNLFRVIRPFVQAGAGLTYFREARDDSSDVLQGYSRSMTVTGGLALNLDYLSSNSGWAIYDEKGIHHSYLTLDYTRQTHLSGDLEMEASGIHAGLTYEF
jgi:hypothetical protein